MVDYLRKQQRLREGREICECSRQYRSEFGLEDNVSSRLSSLLCHPITIDVFRPHLVGSWCSERRMGQRIQGTEA